MSCMLSTYHDVYNIIAQMGLEVHSRLGRRTLLGSSGTHIISDVYLYDVGVLEQWSAEPARMVNEVSAVIAKHGGDVIGHQYHIFDATQKGSLSLLFMLRECHVAIHTWPEQYYVSIDVLCGQHTDAVKLIQDIVSLLDAADTEMMILKRGPGEI